MKSRSFKKIAAVIFILLILSGGGYFAFKKYQNYLRIKNLEEENVKTLEEVKRDEAAKVQKDAEVKTPEVNGIKDQNTKEPPQNKSNSKLLDAPFICQAPLETTENWKSHEDSCEEAAVLQAYLYETGKTMAKSEANNEILKMKDWQNNNFGDNHDLYADELKKFISGFYGIPSDEIEIIYKASIQDIEAYIDKRHPVIVPIRGNILNNPYYPYPGYHMLIAVGYTSDRIITNDNGTRRGKNFSYNKETFLEAMNAAGGDIVVIKLKTKTTSPSP